MSSSDRFDWVPSYQLDIEVAPRIRSVKFGDGYEQRMKDGINNIVTTWSLLFKGRADVEADAINAFLVARAGWDYFLFKPPGSAVYVKVKCTKWKKSYVGPGNNLITTTFEQVFDI
jgi:phage-related protein